MSVIRFSVVIPTRERATTLRSALATCLDQEFDDYEIIVSDNCSSPATRAVVEEANSPRVRYVRTSEPVAMSNNWELGVSHARGEYVTVLGDDDGLLPHALRELDRIAHEKCAKVIRWSAAYYTWPTFALPGQGDYLRVPLECRLCEREGEQVIREVAGFRAFYTELPMLYNAVVHRDILAALRQRVGRVFPHPIPDVYSGFAVAFVAGRFLSSTVPMSVSGQSHASNGIATLFQRGQSPIDHEFRTLNARAELNPEPTVPDLPVFPHVPVADSFVFAKRQLFPEWNITLDRRSLAEACVKGARVEECDWPAMLAAVRTSFADDPALEKWFDTKLAGTPYQPPQPVRLRSAHLGFDGAQMHLDAASLGVSDIAGAVALCERVLNYRDHPINFAPRAEADLAALKISQLSNVCAERERAIIRLHQDCHDLHKQVERLQVSRDESELVNRALVAQLRSERRWSLKQPLRIVKRAMSKLGVVR